jgi:hypothetical protein
VQKSVPTQHVYALACYGIKLKDGKYYVQRVNHLGWSKPYATLKRATTAIARKLEAEWVQRHARMTAPREVA